MVMHQGFGFFEGDEIGSIYDLPLIKWIVSYLGPHWRWILLSFLMVIGITLSELSLPYIVKETIDRYIICTAREVRFDNSVALPKDLIASTLRTTDHQIGFVRSRFLKDLDPRLRARLESEGILGQEPYLILPLYPPLLRRLKESRIGFRLGDKRIFVKMRERDRIPLHLLLKAQSSRVSGIRKMALLYLLLLMVVLGSL
jgi:ABC-type multidrug transport system fused ATPase/permease subunit